MRWFKNGLLVLFTLALAAAGAVMPFAASRWQDSRQAGVEIRSFDSFLLTLKKKDELSQMMRFFTENTYYVFIEDDPAKAVLSETEVREAAAEAVELMYRCGLISKNLIAEMERSRAAGVDLPDIDMSRMVAENNPQESLIVWGIDWYDLGLQIWLDDASGKAFQINGFDRFLDEDKVYDSGSASSTGRTTEALYARMESWRMFVENYYEVKVVDLEDWDYGQGFLFYADLEDGGDLVPIELFMYGSGDFLAIRGGRIE